MCAANWREHARMKSDVHNKNVPNSAKNMRPQKIKTNERFRMHAERQAIWFHVERMLLHQNDEIKNDFMLCAMRRHSTHRNPLTATIHPTLRMDWRNL